MSTESNSFDWEALKQKISDNLDISGSAVQGDQAQKLEERRERYRLAKTEEYRATNELIVFERSGEQYGVPIGQIEEITKLRQLTPLPGIADVVAGLATIRGRVLSLHDISVFNNHKEPLSETPFMLIVNSQYGQLALLADYVEGISDIPVDQIKELPVSYRERSDCFQGITTEGMLVLDMKGLIAHEAFFQA